MSQKAQNIEVLESKNWPCKLLESAYQLEETQDTELGHGTYGSVYKAQNKFDKKYYALKKMENIENKSELGFPITTFREIKLLQGLSHVNILKINQVVFKKSGGSKPPIIFLCLDLMQCDINKLLCEKSYEMSISRIQKILKQTIEGLNYLHQRNIAHRDIKPSNILINEAGIVKIADFGLAKKLNKISTTKVVTLWYRAPQLLLGIKAYTPKVDIWSIGCLAVQLLIGKPLFFEQQSENQVLAKIFAITGTPDECGWEAQVLQDSKVYTQVRPNYSKPSQVILYLKKIAPNYENCYELLDLIQKMLRQNYHSRFTAAECLQHSFFKLELENQQILSSSYFQNKKKQDEYDHLKKKVKFF